MYDFILLTPETISEHQISLLKKTIDANSCGFFDIDDYLLASKHGRTLIFALNEGKKELACFTIDIKAGKGRRVLVMNLFGWESMDDMKLFRDELVAFLFDMAKQNQCTDFLMTGPRYWQKLFPEVKLEACVYHRSLLDDFVTKH